jgi:hypothetical protein
MLEEARSVIVQCGLGLLSRRGEHGCATMIVMAAVLPQRLLLICMSHVHYVLYDSK